MAVPTFRQAGAGVTITTGTGTCSITDCVAKNLIIVHLVVAGLGSTMVQSNNVNLNDVVNNIPGRSILWSGEWIGNPQQYSYWIYVCRAITNGTCSMDFAVGATGEDCFAQAYEFSGVTSALGLASIFEASGGVGGGTIQRYAATSVNLADQGITTLGSDRLILNFVGLSTVRTVAAFAGTTGGTWVEATAEYAGAGAGATLQLQTAEMPLAGTIENGTQVITSTGIGVLGTALLPDLRIGYRRLFGPERLTTSAADLFVVPTGKIVRLRHIYANNPTASPVDFTFSVGTDAAETRLYDSYNIPAGGSLEWAYDHALTAGEKIQAFAGTASALVLTVDAYVQPQ